MFASSGRHALVYVAAEARAHACCRNLVAAEPRHFALPPAAQVTFVRNQVAVVMPATARHCMLEDLSPSHLALTGEKQSPTRLPAKDAEDRSNTPVALLHGAALTSPPMAALGGTSPPSHRCGS
jgi:hypothetical protein